MKQYKKKNEGFTLIEMMVVIAVVGILSAAVLAGLAPSRNKAKDARIVSGVQQARAIAESLYDPFSGGYLAAEPTVAGYTSVEADVMKLNTSGLTYSANGGSFAISASLASGGSYCVDSAGTVNNGTSGSGSCGGAINTNTNTNTNTNIAAAACASYTVAAACDANVGGANLTPGDGNSNNDGCGWTEPSGPCANNF
ncbi:MAG: type II secretion system protein [bacterium]|nr:type II secretion system protein [bacterium]